LEVSKPDFAKHEKGGVGASGTVDPVHPKTKILLIGAWSIIIRKMIRE
jgi:hypothetical protein